jgi:CHAT domain-containing protein
MAGRAAAVARQIVRPDILWEARTTAGKVHLALGQPTLARQAFEEAIATIESLRLNVVGGEQEQQRFFEDKLFPYHAMVELLLAQNQTSEALVFAERAKARVLLDVMRGGRVNVTKAMTADEQEQERSLRSELISLSAQLRQGLQAQPEPADLANLKERLLNARLKYEALQTSLYAAHPELKAQRGEAQTLTPEQAVALLPDAKTALLEFIVAEDKTFLFVLTGNAAAQTPVALKVFSVTIKQKELARLTEQFRQQLAQPGSPVNKLGRELFDLLFKDASPLIRGKDKLVVAPDGPLWEMPFQALLSPRNRYLAQDHAISYAPSLTVLREMIKLRQRKSSEAPTLLAVGNPALGKEIIERRAALMSDRLEPLPDAEKQVRSLSRFYDPRRSKVYVGEAATEARVKTEAGEHGILHMATHGILNDRSPMYSHLVLARTDEQDKEDGLLEAWEIVHLDLRADLAVLSACETARGRVGAGEGMIGLTWAFFVARVPATVVSQWQVRSDSTAELMVEFHRQLQARDAKGTARVTKAEALRRAALKLLGSNQYHHPYFWAGFVVVGDGF